MADIKTNEVNEVTEVEVKEENTEIVETKKKGFHPIKATKKWVNNHPKATKVIVATAGFAAGVAGTLVALAKIKTDDEVDGIDESTYDDQIIDGEFSIKETEATETNC